MSRLVRFFALVTTFSFTLSLGAAQNLGTKISPFKGTDGILRFGLQYATEVDKGLLVTFTVQGNQLIGNREDTISPFYWAIANKETGKLLTAWVVDPYREGYVQPGSTQAFSFSVRDPAQVIEIARTLSKIVIVMSLKNNNPTPAVYLDLEDICHTNPEKIVNLDTGASGCN